MSLHKKAQMEKRAEMKDRITEFKKEIAVKYSGAPVNQALKEVMEEDMREKIAEFFPDEPPPEVEVEIIGTAAVKYHVRFD